MNFRRHIYRNLLRWKDKSKRKPLLKMGARQIGKTTILSLAVYKGKYNPKLRVCISSLNLDQTGDLINIPLFYVEKVDQFIEKAINL